MTRSLATIDYSPLVLAELQLSVAGLVPEIRVFVETRDAAVRANALKQLQQIANALELVGLRGARLLVEETAELLCAPLFDARTDSQAQLKDGDPADEKGSSPAVSNKSAALPGQQGRQLNSSEADYMLFVACEKINEYLEYLKSGGRDSVPALVTLVNNLRASRGARLLSENIVSAEAFNIPLDADAGILGSAGVQRFKTELKACRLPMMQALLAFCSSRSSLAATSKEDIAPLVDIIPLFERLEDTSPNAALQDLWCAAKGLCCSVTEGVLESGPAIRQLLVQLERYTGELQEHLEELPEANASETTPAAVLDSTLFSVAGSDTSRPSLPFADRLFRNLLYYVALSGSTDSDIQAILSRYQLQALVEELPSASGRLDSFQPGNKVDASVIRSLGDEISEVQSQVAQHAEFGLLTTEQLQIASKRLAQLGPTLMLLGESECEKTVELAATTLGDIAVNPDPMQMQRLATDLLLLGEHLEDLQHGGAGYDLVANSFEHDMLGERQMSAYRLDQIVARCMGEARARLTDVETVYLGFSDMGEAGFATQSDTGFSREASELDNALNSSLDSSSSLTEATDLRDGEIDHAAVARHHASLIEAAAGVDSARDALMIIPLPEVSPLLDTISSYLRRCAEHSHMVREIPPMAHSAFADLVVSTSHYLHGNIQRQSVASDLLMQAEVAMQRIQPALDNDFEDLHAAFVRDSENRTSTAPELTGEGADRGANVNSEGLSGQMTKSFVQPLNAGGALIGDKTGALERGDAIVPPAAKASQFNAEVGTSMANTFTESAIQRIGAIGRLLRQWHIERSADLLQQMKKHYEDLENTSAKASAMDLQNFSRVNKDMLGVLLERSDSVLESEEMLMQESVAVLPQLLNQLQFAAADDLAAAKSGAAATHREPVDGLSDLLNRLAEVKPPARDAGYTKGQDRNLDINSSVAMHDMDATQELDQTAIDTVAATLHEDVAEDTLANGETWADAEPPKARTLFASRAPRINIQQIRQAQPPAISAAVMGVEDAEKAKALASDSLESGDSDITEQVSDTTVEETLQSVMDAEVTVDSAFAGAPGENFESTVALESDDDARHLLSTAAIPLSMSAATSVATGDQSDDTVDVSHDATADSTLFRVFRGECSGHIATLRGVSQTALDAGVPVNLQKRFTRTLHTLHGSALTAEEKDVAELAGTLEKYTGYFKRRSLALEKQHWAVVVSAVDGLSSALDARAVGASAAQYSEPQVARLSSALDGLKTLSVSGADGSDVDDTGSFDSGGIGGSGGPRGQLFPIFIDEADAILRKLQGMHEQLHVASDQHLEADFSAGNKPQLVVLKDALRQLHTLKGSARVAGCDQLAALAHQIEHSWLQWRNSERAVDADRQVLFQSSVDALVINLEQARTGQELGDFDLLLSELEQDLAEPRSTAISLKEPGSSDIEHATLLSKQDASDQAGFSNQLYADHQRYDQTLELTDTDSLSSTVVTTPAGASDASDTSVADSNDDAGTLVVAIPELDETAVVDDSQGTEFNTEREAESADQQLSSVRVNTTLLGRLASLSTQISVQHASMSQGVSRLSESLLDLDKVAASLRQRLRDLDLETSLLPDNTQAGESDRENRDLLYAGETVKTEGDEAADTSNEKQLSSQQNKLASEESSRQLSEVLHDLDTIRDSLHERLRYGEEALARSSRLTSDIHESVLMAKLIRFDEFSHRLETVVRQSARSLNKLVRLELQGGGVAVEQEIHRQLAAPLEHLLRNAIAHGIEQPATRQAAGKPEQGRILLQVRIDGNQLKVDVTDDGGGVDFAALRKMTGQIGAGKEAGDDEILDMLLTRDLSTQSKANFDAGRGVGLGSVNQMLQDLNGNLRFLGSDSSGTRVRMSIPLQLQINHAVVFECNGSRFGIAANYVRAVENQSQYESQAQLQHHAETDSRPYWLDIASLTGGADGEKPRRPATAQRLLDDDAESEQVIRLEVNGRSVYLQPDRLVGFRDLITRPIGTQLNSLGLYSGVSMESDGSKVLLLDVASLVSAQGLLSSSPPVENMSAGVSLSLSRASDDTSNMSKGELRQFVDEVDFGNGSDHVAETVIKPTRDVMIVDDSVTLRTYTSGVLESAGLSPLEARDGLEALEVL